MSLWEDFKNLFQQEQDSSPSNPLLHEVIKRSEEEQQAFAKWEDTLVKRRLMDWLHQQYINYLVNPKDTEETIDFLNRTSSKGFVIYLKETGYTKSDSIFFMDYLKEKVLSNNYKTYISDSRSYTKPEYVETIQRHYLKPRINLSSTEKLKQAFGNITIELLLRNEQVVNLKFRANSYQDRKFEEASDFKELMGMILEN